MARSLFKPSKIVVKLTKTMNRNELIKLFDKHSDDWKIKDVLLKRLKNDDWRLTVHFKPINSQQKLIDELKQRNWIVTDPKTVNQTAETTVLE